MILCRQIGPNFRLVVTDNVTPTPEGTYGPHKLSTEIIINDMHRKGFVDAFIVRFPTKREFRLHFGNMTSLYTKLFIIVSNGLLSDPCSTTSQKTQRGNLCHK
ncbi:nucleoside-diphosphate-sugar epimerase [Apiospora saccharicola]